MFQKLIDKFKGIEKFVELEIKYKKINGNEYYILDIYFEAERYSGGREKEVFETIEELEKYIDNFILNYNL